MWFENLDEAKIDWSQTNAYVNEAYRSSPAVWLNHSKCRHNGELHDLLNHVEHSLASLIDPRTGRPVISHCHRPHDIYHGPHTMKAPDLLPSWWEDGFLLDQSDAARRRRPTSSGRRRRFKAASNSPRRTGSMAC